MKVANSFFRISAVLALGALVGCSSNSPLELKSGRQRFSAALTSYNSCAELESDLKTHFKDELRNRLIMLRESNVYGYPVALGGEATPDAATSAGASPKVEGIDYSGTNNQERGVDEADFTKTDGNFIYIVNGNYLEILGIASPGAATYLSSLKIEGSPSQMLVFGDRVAIFSFAGDFGIVGPAMPLIDSRIWYPQKAKITVVRLDFARTNPTVESEWYFDGTFVAGRKIGNKIFAVSHYGPIIKDVIEYPQLNLPENFNWSDQAAVKAAWEDAIDKAIRNNDAVIDAITLDDLVPHFYVKAQGEFVPQALSEADCRNFSAPQDSVARSFSTILTLDMNTSVISPVANHIVSNSPLVYASTSTLLLAEPSEDSWWFYGNDDVEEATNIHRFAVSSDAATSYTGSGRIDGTILNQFSLSEHNGFVRAVSTTGRFNRWFVPEDQRRESENHLFVLGGATELQLQGKIDGIAPGERIWSSRFDGNKAYLVTFRNIDPLFTIDVSDPSRPTLVGELHVPGVSTYIHPLDGNYLLNVGYGGNESALDWSTNVALYNVNDFANPVQTSVLSFAPTSGSVGDGWNFVSSEANYEHKAITYWAAKELLAIPVSTYRSRLSTSVAFEYEYVSKLKLVHAKAGEALSLFGEIDHSEFFNSGAKTYFYTPDIRRSIFMDDFVYAISLKGVTAHRLSDMQRTAKVDLKGFDSIQ